MPRFPVSTAVRDCLVSFRVPHRRPWPGGRQWLSVIVIHRNYTAPWSSLRACQLQGLVQQVIVGVRQRDSIRAEDPLGHLGDESDLIVPEISVISSTCSQIVIGGAQTNVTCNFILFSFIPGPRVQNSPNSLIAQRSETLFAASHFPQSPGRPSVDLPIPYSQSDLPCMIHRACCCCRLKSSACTSQPSRGIGDPESCHSAITFEDRRSPLVVSCACVCEQQSGRLGCQRVFRYASDLLHRAVHLRKACLDALYYHHRTRVSITYVEVRHCWSY